jgi:hypothetical protein
MHVVSADVVVLIYLNVCTPVTLRIFYGVDRLVLERLSVPRIALTNVHLRSLGMSLVQFDVLLDQ